MRGAPELPIIARLRVVGFALRTIVLECELASATSYLVDEETPLWGFLLPGDSGSGSDRGYDEWAEGPFFV
ncbi:hypothetical protein BA177_10040 [Woeseia oceani]|uniref:Uncharacterized protein n=1 Tax=Woeseia oceani TaxID=1548547 RepID=A0A193LGK9_9GAMM|nr:hypothetical protein BA177_10040 [Woeseia oceani]